MFDLNTRCKQRWCTSISFCTKRGRVVKKVHIAGSRITVVIADQDPMLRDVLSLVLRDQPDFAVLASDSSAEGAIASVTTRKPDILLVDILLPGMSCLHVAASYRSVSTRPMLMCAKLDYKLVLEGLYRGSLGVWMKEDLNLLAESLRCVASGGYWNRTQEVLDLGSLIRAIEDEAPKRKVRLTAREKEVVLLTSRGMTDRDIGERLNMREQTVKRHLFNMLDKLGISNRSELARFVLERGLNSAIQGGKR